MFSWGIYQKHSHLTPFVSTNSLVRHRTPPSPPISPPYLFLLQRIKGFDALSKKLIYFVEVSIALCIKDYNSLPQPLLIH